MGKLFKFHSSVFVEKARFVGSKKRDFLEGLEMTVVSSNLS